MTRKSSAVAAVMLLLLFGCEREKGVVQDDSTDRGAKRKKPPAVKVEVVESVDWNESAAVFIGIERFAPGSDGWPDVEYASDDAADMAYLFSGELKKLPADRMALILAGRPHKAASRNAVNEMRDSAALVSDSSDTPVTPAMIYEQVGASARMVGPDGVFIIFIVTHGLSVSGEHLLLTPEATRSTPRGVTLQKLLEAIPPDHGRRVLLFVDACRADEGYINDTAMPSKLLENIKLPPGYAIFTAAVPGGYAEAHDELQNGVFTRAVLEAFRARTHAIISPAVVNAYISTRVPELSKKGQRPEGRFCGLDNLPLIVSDPGAVATIITPQEGASVKPLDYVDVQAFDRGLYGTVFICAGANNVCYNQNSAAVPQEMPEDQVRRMTVHYGDTDRFEVYVALSADRNFFRGVRRISSGLRTHHRADRIVYWYGPINVVLKEEA